jgi:hypothetical protein
MAVAATVFGTALIAFVPLLKSVGEQQRAAQQHFFALREADNVLERLTQRPWNEITTDEFAKITLTEEAQQFLPQAKLQVTVHESPQLPREKRVSVELSWMPRRGNAHQSVKLVAWFIQPEDQR